MADDLVLRELSDGVLTLTLNRPERNNAFTVPLEHAYYDSLEAAARDEAVRVIVLTGAGKSFCPGLDVEVLQEGLEAGGRLLTDKPRRPPTFPLSIPKPIIAAINRPAAGIGLTLTLTADIRFAVRGAKLTTAWARRGLVGEHGMTWLIPRMIGGARGLDLTLSGRTLLSDEAHELGLIHRLTEPGESVDGRARVRTRPGRQRVAHVTWPSSSGRPNETWSGSKWSRGCACGRNSSQR